MEYASNMASASVPPRSQRVHNIFACAFFLACACIVVIASVDVVAPPSPPGPGPKLSDYAESEGLVVTGPKNGAIVFDDGSPGPDPVAPLAGQESRVSIQVGETGFFYTINGITNSPSRIAVSGNYYNNDIFHTGYVDIFLVAEPRICDVRLFPDDEGVYDVTIWNCFGQPFYYEILSPYPVNTYTDIRPSAFNDTAILIQAPSRNAYFPRSSQVNNIGANQGKLVSAVNNDQPHVQK